MSRAEPVIWREDLIHTGCADRLDPQSATAVLTAERGGATRWRS